MSDTRNNAVRLMRRFGLEPDSWQAEVLKGGQPRLLLNCCRQAGKSTVVAVLGLAEALFVPGSCVLLLSRSHRQSTELFRILSEFHRRLDSPMLRRRTSEELLLHNHSRVVCLPCREDTIRGYASVSLLVIDEAARVPDDLYRAVRPMLAVSGGRLICLSTPYGRRGFFWQAWAQRGDDWARIEVPAEQIPRIKPTFLEGERRALGEAWYRQEYQCSFESLEGLVFPDFARCVCPPPRPSPTRGEGVREASSPTRERELFCSLPPCGGVSSFSLPPCGGGLGWGGLRRVGGLDFGFRNPFAAIWGHVDRDGILWLTGEHYCRGRPLSYHARHLPRDVTWYADPSGANERCELICAGFTVRAGSNALRPGIAAVSARLEAGTLKVIEGCCPNLLAEASLYRYGEEGRDRRAEMPVDENNHALSALRYLISKLDARHLGKDRPTTPDASPDESLPDPHRPKPDPWLRLDNEELWTIL